MDAVIERFDKGISELKLYLRLLRSIESQSTRLRLRPANSDQCFRIMKASTFLLMYNVVEFGVRAAFDALYGAMRTNGLTYPDVIKELQDEWLGQAFRDLTPESANKQSYFALTKQLLEQVNSSAVLQMSARKMSISGNLDAVSIRAICRKHKIELRVHYRALGGAELSTVKDKRNALAHGHVTFSECGREYTVNDLDRISRQTTSFVRGFLGSVKSYSDQLRFRAI